MTDYNDGKWHGWNGGECPVHSKSIVEVVTHLHGKIGECAASTKGWWANHSNPIIAFRVIKPHREPREFYIAHEFEGSRLVLFKSKAQAQESGWGGDDGMELIHVCEVLPD